MDKKEFVQRFMIENYYASGFTADEKLRSAIYSFDMIEKAFAVTPTTNLWDYNDMQR